MGITEATGRIRELIETGGPLLWVLFAVTAAICASSAERGLALGFVVPAAARHRQQAFAASRGRPSWRRRLDRDRLRSELRLLATARLGLLGSLVALCPLLGLLGTVTGMLEVFDVVEQVGHENPRAMAAGISQAILSTLAGLVGALAGYIPRELLLRRSERALARFDDALEAPPPPAPRDPRPVPALALRRALVGAAALGLGVLGAGLLFVGMSTLVRFGAARLEASPPPPRLGFARELTDAPRPPPPPRPERPRAATPPRLPSDPDAAATDAPETRAALPLEAGPLPALGGELRLGAALSAGTVRDREAVAVVRVDPAYPEAARARGLEGQVSLRFTIAADGSVRDIEILAAEPASTFERAAIRALGRWRYDPKLVDGVPVPQPGQTVTLEFRLDEDEGS